MNRRIYFREAFERLLQEPIASFAIHHVLSNNATILNMAAYRLQKINDQHRRFCREVVMGIAQTDAYLIVWPNSTRKSAMTRSSILMAQPIIQDELARLRERCETEFELSFAEKRALLADIARANLASLVDDSGNLKEGAGRLIQDWKVTFTKDGEKHITIKLLDKLRAIDLDNRMVGQSEAKPKGCSLDISAILARLEPTTNLPRLNNELSVTTAA